MAGWLGGWADPYIPSHISLGTTHKKLMPDTFVTRLVDKVSVKGKNGGMAWHLCIASFGRKLFTAYSLSCLDKKHKNEDS